MRDVWEISVSCLSWAETCLLGLDTTKMESRDSSAMKKMALFNVPVQAHS